MNPRDFSASVLLTRLELMRELLADLDQIGDVTEVELIERRITRRALERILTQLEPALRCLRAQRCAVARGSAGLT